MATYGRGRHIAPSIRSVLGQSLQDFELLVVGDHCTDETAAVVAAFASPKIRWINLATRAASQSGPNNAGIAAARGRIIAYLGHDDVWEPDHLASIGALFDAAPDLDFAVGGAIYHMPNGADGSLVTGLFEDDSAKHDHFFPPSSFAHRHSVCARIGLWQMAADIRAPVDADFLLRAAGAGLHFASTGRITLHKFAAGHRYLSYLEHASDEQNTLLASLGHPDHSQRLDHIVAASKRDNTFMIARHATYADFEPGELARQNATRKGLVQAAPTSLGRGAVLNQEPSFCAVDWRDAPEDGIRWTTLNPMPKMLLPYTGPSRVTVSIEAVHANKAALRLLVFRCNGCDHAVRSARITPRGSDWTAQFDTVVRLRPDGHTILEFRLRPSQMPTRTQRGIGIGQIRLAPETLTSRVARHIAAAAAQMRRGLRNLRGADPD